MTGNLYNRDFFARFERAERSAMDGFYEAIPVHTREALGMQRIDTEECCIYLARHEPDILLNRVINLGAHKPVSERTLSDIVGLYAEAGISRYFLQVQPWVVPPHTWQWIFRHNLVRQRGWTVFHRDNRPVDSARSDLRVELIGPDHANDFAHIVARGFGLSEAVRPALQAMVGQDNWYHFMSFAGDRPAGAAALHVCDGLAWLDWAATDPEFRARGSQSALLSARIQHAIDLGCHGMTSETGEAVANDPQHSFNNLMRFGFTPTHTRDNFSPAANS